MMLKGTIGESLYWNMSDQNETTMELRFIDNASPFSLLSERCHGYI